MPAFVPRLLWGVLFVLLVWYGWKLFFAAKVI
jgi:hypothetical protein